MFVIIFLNDLAAKEKCQHVCVGIQITMKISVISVPTEIEGVRLERVSQM